MVYKTMATVIRNRADLAKCIDLPLKSMLYILYGKDRSHYYTEKQIVKSSGSIRKLHAVNGALKGVQRKTLDWLQSEFYPTVHSHGFTKNRSIISNAIPHRRKKIIVKLDIEDFFPTICFSRVKGMFSASPFHFGEEASLTLAQISCLPGNNGQLPQGGVMSPFISNMICRRLDSRMAGIAKVFRCNFTRYADDITFSTNDVNKLDITKLLGQLYQTIEEEGFVPNKKKTKILTPKDRQIVTGIVVNKGINVNRKYIRNLRATIYNIEKYGINSQIVKKPYSKDKHFRNGHASRPDIQKNVDGYLFRGQPKSTDEAALHFLRHVSGQLAFVGQVVTAAAQAEQPENYPRIRTYKQLLLRFYKVVVSDKKRRFKPVEKMIMKQFKKHGSIAPEKEWFQKRNMAREKGLDRWRKRDETQQEIALINSIKKIEDIQNFVRRKANKDPRYMKMISANLEEARKEVLELLSFPPFSQEKTFRILSELKDTSQLGAITHDSSDKSVSDLLKILLESFERYYYEIHLDARGLFDDVSKVFRDVVMLEGESYLLHVFEDRGTQDAVKRLKVGTRLRADKDASSGGTDVLEFFESVKSKALKNSGIENIDIDSKNIRIAQVYTFVPLLRQALVDIVESMLRNTKSNTIKVSSYKANDNSGPYVIQVLDESDVVLDMAPSREFANGKLRRAIAKLNSICGYWVTARFDDGEAYCVDMLKNNAVRCELDGSIGVIHHLVLPTFGTPDPLHPNEFYFKGGESKRCKKLSHSSDKPGRILILDNNSSRLKENTETLRLVDNIDIDARSSIEENEFMEGGYAMALVHKSNLESDKIYEDWAPHTFPIVFFSGGTTSELKNTEKGKYWHTSANYLKNNIHTVVSTVISNAHYSGKIGRILILDNNSSRLRENTEMASLVENIEIDARSSIEEIEFMEGGYALALVHASNLESDKIYEDWAPHTFPIVFFSGGATSELKNTEKGKYWHTSANYLKNNIHTVISGVISSANLS